jgi:hypothetical protein
MTILIPTGERTGSKKSALLCRFAGSGNVDMSGLYGTNILFSLHIIGYRLLFLFFPSTLQ